jgi:hypothetical protein
MVNLLETVIEKYDCRSLACPWSILFSSKRARGETAKISHILSQLWSHDENRSIFSCVFLTGHNTGVTENQQMNVAVLSNWL